MHAFQGRNGSYPPILSSTTPQSTQTSAIESATNVTQISTEIHLGQAKHALTRQIMFISTKIKKLTCMLKTELSKFITYIPPVNAWTSGNGTTMTHHERQSHSIPYYKR